MSQSGEDWLVDVLTEGQDHPCLLYLPVQHHLGGDGTRVADSLGHGSVSQGVAILDHVDPLELPPVVWPLDGDLVPHEDHVSLPLPIEEPLIEVVAQLREKCYNRQTQSYVLCIYRVNR